MSDSTRTAVTCTDPSLTTVPQPIETMGQAAVDLLVTQIEGAEVATDGSTGPAPRR